MTRIFSRILMFSLSFFVLISCEQEDKLTGISVLGSGDVSFDEQVLGLDVTNMFSNSIRSDRKAMISFGEGGGIVSGACVGVFDEPIFGKTKADLYMQPRMSALSPNFGKDPQIDSIVLYLPVQKFKKDTISKDVKLLETRFEKTKEEGCGKVVDTVYTYREMAKFELDSLYGKKDMKMKLQVHQVIEPMYSVDSVLFSNKKFATGNLLGEVELSKYGNTESFYTVRASTAKKNQKKYLSKEEIPSVKVKLNGLNNLILNEVLRNPMAIKNQAIFVNRILKGLKISVSNDQGFLININPLNARLNVYYNRVNESFKDKNSNGVDDNEETCDVKINTPRVNTTFQFFMGSLFNVYQSGIENQKGSIDYNTVSSDKIYLEGMGGSFAKLHIKDRELDKFRENVKKNNWAIMEAYLRIYPDKKLQGNLPLPEYLTVYNYSEKELIDDYVGSSRVETPFVFSDISRRYNEKTGFYQLKITRLLKNIIEENKANVDLALEIGNYYNPDNQAQYQPKYYWAKDRIHNPYRIILEGNDTSEKSIKLVIKYAKK